MSLAENLREIKNKLPEGVTLVAVSKTKPAEAIQTLLAAGQLDFGENKVQEMIEKQAVLPDNIRWHLIGHLQKNKVKYIAEFVHLIHSVDSEKLLAEINKQAVKHQRVIPCLLQIKIAEEDTKFGMDFKDAKELMNNYKSNYPNVKIVGLMGMATLTDDENQIRREFQQLNNSFESFKEEFPEMEILSMGMTGDYAIAISEGSNMVRIGSAIFGKRS